MTKEQYEQAKNEVDILWLHYKQAMFLPEEVFSYTPKPIYMTLITGRIRVLEESIKEYEGNNSDDTERQAT